MLDIFTYTYFDIDGLRLRQITPSPQQPHITYFIFGMLQMKSLYQRREMAEAQWARDLQIVQ